MKHILYILSYFLLILTCVGCNKNTGTEEITEPIELNRRVAKVNKNKPIDKLHIYSGNGGYTLIFPKQIEVGRDQITYSETIFKLTIDNDNNIVIERKLLNDQMVSGLFLVKDNKGLKKLFAVDDPDYIGYIYDFKELESKYQNNTDYWQ